MNKVLFIPLHHFLVFIHAVMANCSFNDPFNEQLPFTVFVKISFTWQKIGNPVKIEKAYVVGSKSTSLIPGAISLVQRYYPTLGFHNFDAAQRFFQGVDEVRNFLHPRQWMGQFASLAERRTHFLQRADELHSLFRLLKTQGRGYDCFLAIHRGLSTPF